MSAAPQHDPTIDPVEAALADRALWGRSEATNGTGDAVSLRLADHLDEGFDLAAAAIDVAIFPPTEPAPAALRAKVAERVTRVALAARPDAPLSAEPREGARTSTQIVGDDQHRAFAREPREGARTSAASPRWGWYAAAIAAVIAGAAWLPEWRRPAATPPATADFLMTRLLEEPTTTRVQCACTEDPLCSGATVCGDVVWNRERGEGFLRVEGIAPNDPSEFQYQLWIVDASRDERYPVDGGVFDVPSGCREVVIPIKAALPVREAALFAVSVEKPGGTVVSDRRFVLVAPVG